MSRPLRIEFQGAHYHVMNRGNARNSIFLIDDDYGVFLAVLEEATRLFYVKVLSYCLMTNHYHLLIHTPKGNLSRFMRHLGAVYTQRFNKIHKKDGHLFRGRFKAILVQEDEYLTHLIRYIHLNPAQANLVQDPKDYLWSSHSDFLKGKDSQYLNVKEALSYFSPIEKEAKKLYLEFLKSGVDLKTKVFFKNNKQGSVFGDIDFIDKIKEKYLLVDKKPSEEIPEKRSDEGLLMIKKIKKSILERFRLKESSLYASIRGEYNKPRTLALALSRELSGLKLQEVARAFKMRSYKTVSSSCQRFKASLVFDERAWREYDEVRRGCMQGET